MSPNARAAAALLAMAAVGAGLYQLAMHVSFARPKRDDRAEVAIEPTQR